MEEEKNCKHGYNMKLTIHFSCYEKMKNLVYSSKFVVENKSW